MKAWIVIVAVCLMGCKKNQEISNLKDQITGTWEIEKFISPDSIQTFPAGNGNIMVLKKNDVFERRKHDTLIFKGKYTLKEKKDCYPGNSDMEFSTNESPYNKFYIDMENGKLLLSTPNCYMDGGTGYYRRLE